MIDHLCIVSSVELFDATVAFYEAALAPMGYTKLVSMFDGKLIGFGVKAADFWISPQGFGGSHYAVSGLHFAFAAEDHATVNKCYEAGLAAGGKDNGKPGPRAHYGPNYYGGFLIDPNGNGMEFVNKDGKTG